MARAILTTKVDPTYDDLPEQRYHFPRTYLRQVEAARGDWVIYYEPRRTSGDLSSRGGRQAYFATARITDIIPDLASWPRTRMAIEAQHHTRDEVTVVVEEATNWGKYVGAHAYSAPAIARVVELGVRTIEHGNLIDAATAKLMAEKDAFLVPTLATYDAMKHKGAAIGMSKDMLAKNDEVYFAGIQALEHARAAGVNVAFGSDLLGELQTHQTNEFRIRSEVFTMQQIIQSATTMAAKLLRKEGELGVLAPGAFADLLVVNGNPLKDPDIFQDGGPNLAAIMKAGEFHRNSL